ncbi:MAG: hypothetical protein K5853_09215 [Lachnospiraceae bacterium]|nr:hypothetical protein [Lachnospiraceae bacterium]
MKRRYVAMILAGTVILGTILTGCSSTSSSAADTTVQKVEAVSANETSTELSEDSIRIDETIENSADGEHAIEVDGEEKSYSNVQVIKTGDSEGDEADFYGENSAVFATNGATLTLSEMIIESDGEHANGVFSYGEGTTVNISDSVITTTGNCSGGIMTTGGGTTNAENLTIYTSGRSSAAIRSDRGGGTVNVTGGSYTTDGVGSPTIYSTADITVEDATLTSTKSEGVVVEGKNSVTLKDVDLTAENTELNSDKSDTYKAVMIYQSMSGDADEGTASFTAEGGSITNKNGDVFFVNNTTAVISLTGTAITNEDSEGLFLRAAAAGWGSEGSNGGQVTLNASGQTIDGNMIVDEVSTLNMYLADSSEFTGAINTDGASGDVYVELTDGSKWTLTGDSYITSLTCDADSIDLNGYKLYVNGKEYTEGTASTGEAVEAKQTSSSNSNAKPDGEAPDGAKPDGNPPEKPDGEAPSGNPPEKPSDN